MEGKKREERDASMGCKDWGHKWREEEDMKEDWVTDWESFCVCLSPSLVQLAFLSLLHQSWLETPQMQVYCVLVVCCLCVFITWFHPGLKPLTLHSLVSIPTSCIVFIWFAWQSSSASWGELYNMKRDSSHLLLCYIPWRFSEVVCFSLPWTLVISRL